jgi:hypothetical protein
MLTDGLYRKQQTGIVSRAAEAMNEAPGTEKKVFVREIYPVVARRQDFEERPQYS